MAKTCATCEHWSGRFGDPPKAYTVYEYECTKIAKELLMSIECTGCESGDGSIVAIETSHDFGCVLYGRCAEAVVLYGGW